MQPLLWSIIAPRFTGLSNSEIAAARGKSVGTVKAQCNAIYQKAGVSGRTQLISHFIEDLFDEASQD